MFTIESIYIIDRDDFCCPHPELKAVATIVIAGKIRVTGFQIIQSAPGKPVEVIIPSSPPQEVFMDLEFIEDDLKLEVESAILRAYAKLLGVLDLPKAPERGNAVQA